MEGGEGKQCVTKWLLAGKMGDDNGGNASTTFCKSKEGSQYMTDSDMKVSLCASAHFFPRIQVRAPRVIDRKEEAETDAEVKAICKRVRLNDLKWNHEELLKLNGVK